MPQGIGWSWNCIASGIVLAISQGALSTERKIKPKGVDLGKTGRGKKKMTASTATRKITLDPYILVLFVEKVLAEPELKDDEGDEKESTKKKD
ncbi:hypothetical protein AMJ40_06420 [candidate division TA06 bacterium DG_26]|uniref:Uncharacterized protein n=1 Tax=candidate division TA06 bacterium DG_26 TaxID=1703771 RepID=A0A0S7WHG9_UNCT6|nr:MAG: hypothetical protein AMJ40_06420 [candidate division TA06 bacterium DG_26]